MRDLASQHSSFCSAIGESHGSVYYWTDPKRDAFYSDYSLQRYLERDGTNGLHSKMESHMHKLLETGLSSALIHAHAVCARYTILVL